MYWLSVNETEGGLTNGFATLRTLPRGNKDDHVLTRVVREGPLKGQVSHHTPNTITYRLNKLQEAAGLEKSGPHRLRHACLTILAGCGTDPYRLQAHARHSRLSTTQKYIHLAKKTEIRLRKSGGGFELETEEGRARCAGAARPSRPPPTPASPQGLRASTCVLETWWRRSRSA